MRNERGGREEAGGLRNEVGRNGSGGLKSVNFPSAITQAKSDRTPRATARCGASSTNAAHAAVKTKGSAFQTPYRRLLPRLGHNKAIWAVAHRLCRLLWKILHQTVDYIEFGPQRSNSAYPSSLDNFAAWFCETNRAERGSASTGRGGWMFVWAE